MSQTGLPQLDTTIQKTHTWLRELMEELDWQDRGQAWHALRAVLHALRDWLTVDEVAGLGAHLPMLLRGLYYEGWHPTSRSGGARRGEFLDRVASAFRDRPDIEPDAVARAVFRVLARHVTAGEIADVKHLLPHDLRALWPC